MTGLALIRQSKALAFLYYSFYTEHKSGMMILQYANIG